MMHSHIDSPEYLELVKQPLFAQVFAWIKNNANTLPEGEHDIQNRDVYANLFSANTLTRDQATYEAHQKYIDLHYCLEGGERIEATPVTNLQSKTEHDAEKDYQLFQHPDQNTEIVSLLMNPNDFAIFYPGEAHMPKISDDKHPNVKKVVIKILQTL